MLSLRILPTAALLLGSCAMCPLSGEAGQIDYETARIERTLPAVRAAGPIRIDGALDEPDWARAPMARGFVQSDPREGEPATEDTDVRVLYDANNLHFGVFAHDREPYNIDFFLVFNERRDSNTGGLLDRALVAKMTYMVAF